MHGALGPVTLLDRVRDLDKAVALVNDSPYGLTASVHTASLHRALALRREGADGRGRGERRHVRLGAAHGFRRVKDSGTGWREAGVEASTCTPT